jgi:hypothetical protein
MTEGVGLAAAKRVRVTSPKRCAIHKLIVAYARTGTHRAKVEKDLAQAAALIEALVKGRRYELSAALAEARGRGPKWPAAIAGVDRRGVSTPIGVASR